MMTLLLAAAVAAGAANVALVAFVADRLSLQSGASVGAGELIAVTEGTLASGNGGAVEVVNENTPAARATLAA
ncbi:hypothetical protein [Methylobacterium nigriterrae]|uniref:hypothetical protein n=1 Tax=Methylobacterium nigriterrae TaxID=3127512 RepID=UPI00301381C1